jgi:hypothetical protein
MSEMFPSASISDWRIKKRGVDRGTQCQQMSIPVLWVGDHPLHELAALRQHWFRSSYEHPVGCFAPVQHVPRPQMLPQDVPLWQPMPMASKDGSWVCVTWMNKDAECCSMHACITLRRFCTAHDTRTRHSACENPHPCARMPACCSARMYSAYAHIHAHARHMTTKAYTYDTHSVLFGKPGPGVKQLAVRSDSETDFPTQSTL